MNSDGVMELARQGIMVGIMVSLPVLAVALFTGLIVSVFQAVTQVQEMTLTYVPKLVGVGIVIATMGGWMLMTLVKFTAHCLEYATRVGA